MLRPLTLLSHTGLLRVIGMEVPGVLLLLKSWFIFVLVVIVDGVTHFVLIAKKLSVNPGPCHQSQGSYRVPREHPHPLVTPDFPTPGFLHCDNIFFKVLVYAPHLCHLK